MPQHFSRQGSPIDPHGLCANALQFHQRRQLAEAVSLS
jgi:hypothetical protein